MSAETSSTAIDNLDWYKSSYSSGAGGQCVEVAAVPGAVRVRDSKDPSGPVLTFGREAWASFLEFTAPR